MGTNFRLIRLTGRTSIIFDTLKLKSFRSGMLMSILSFKQRQVVFLHKVVMEWVHNVLHVVTVLFFVLIIILVAAGHLL